LLFVVEPLLDLLGGVEEPLLLFIGLESTVSQLGGGINELDIDFL
jgi:hypothetical protein